MIYANISATSNIKALEETIESIYNQFDEINICFSSNQTITDKKINVVSVEREDTNNKFFFLDKVNGFYFTIDSGILYPPNYVKATIPRFCTYDIVTYGGKNFRTFPFIDYDTSCTKYHYSEAKDRDRQVQFGHTGTMAFHVNDFKFRRKELVLPNLTEPLIGCLAKDKNKLIYCLAHDRNWIVNGKYYDKEEKDERKTIYVNKNYKKLIK